MDERNSGGAAAAKSSDLEIVATRVFDAPRGLVFEAWTDPQRITQWWGPNGFTTTTHEMDGQPGGLWRFVIHGPDGVDYNNRIVYLEIVKPERLVYKHAPEQGTEPVNFEVNVDFCRGRQKNQSDRADGVPIDDGARVRGQEIWGRRGTGADPGSARGSCGQDGNIWRVWTVSQ